MIFFLGFGETLAKNLNSLLLLLRTEIWRKIDTFPSLPKNPSFLLFLSNMNKAYTIIIILTNQMVLSRWVTLPGKKKSRKGLDLLLQKLVPSIQSLGW